MDICIGDVANEMGDMDLEQYEEDDDDEGEMEEGAERGVPPREDAAVIFTEHTGGSIGMNEGRGS